MTSYYLLRNNQESGPFTKKELKALPLLTTDLVWINGESTCWRHPAEIDGLETLAKEPAKTLPAKKVPTDGPAKKIETPSPEEVPTWLNNISAYTEKEPSPEVLAKPSFEELQKKYSTLRREKKSWKRQANIGANLMGVVILLLGVTMAAYMIKKAVENLEMERPVFATADARSLESSQSHNSTSSQAALAPVAVAVKQQVVPGDTVRTNTVTIEKLPQKVTASELSTAVPTNLSSQVKPTVEKPLKETWEPTVHDSDKVEATTHVQPDAEKNLSEEPEESKPAKANLLVSANDYKVGFLGGISQLELSVKNPSAQTVRKAIVEVEFLKPSGKVIHTETIEVSAIAPGTSKKIAVPGNNRGVSIRYRVVAVET